MIMAHSDSVGTCSPVGSAAAAQPAKVIGDGLVNVASVVAMSRPVQVPPVIVAPAPERTVPTKSEVVVVVAAEVFQKTGPSFDRLDRAFLQLSELLGLAFPRAGVNLGIRDGHV